MEINFGFKRDCWNIFTFDDALNTIFVQVLRFRLRINPNDILAKPASLRSLGIKRSFSEEVSEKNCF